MATQTKARATKSSAIKSTTEQVVFPKYIHFKSDDTVLELQDTITEVKKTKAGKFIKTPTVGKYKYIKAVPIEKGGTMMGTTIDFTIERIQTMISKHTITTTEEYGRPTRKSSKKV